MRPSGFEPRTSTEVALSSALSNYAKAAVCVLALFLYKNKETKFYIIISTDQQ